MLLWIMLRTPWGQRPAAEVRSSLTCMNAIPRVWMKKTDRTGGYGGQVAHAFSVEPVQEPALAVASDTLPLDFGGAPAAAPQVEVRRSKRRRRSVSAYREGDRTIVLIPARMTRAEEAEWVEVMLRQLEKQEQRSKPSDQELIDRAHRLSREHLGARAVPASVRWVGNQRTRWGSCTVDDRSIRLSDRLQPMPDWVVDYVLLHELAHLIEPSHGPQFWSLLESYPHLERARGFLDGWSLGRQDAGVRD